MSLVRDGKVISNNTPQVVLTRDAYDKMVQAGTLDPDTNYFVKDDADDEYTKLMSLMTLTGSNEALVGHADGTIIGCIADLYNRLGGLSFSTDEEKTYVKATYSDENPKNAIKQLAPDSSDSDQINYLYSILGSPSALTGLGYGTLAEAILDMYERLDDLSFSMNSETNTVEVTDNKK